MRPNDDKLQPPSQRGHVTPPARDYRAHHGAAANITRDQLETIYSDQASKDAEQSSPYQQTQQPSHQINQADWQQYHSSWQQYYQKYYEHYYVGAVQQVHSAYQDHVSSLHQNDQPLAATPEQVTPQQAADELRSELRGKIQQRADKVKKSRHFMPALIAAGVAIVFVFVQYNSNIKAYAEAYVTPGNTTPLDVIVDPTQNTEVGPEPRLIIPKINVNVPVDYDATTDHDSQMEAMRDGVAYFGIAGANSKPGQRGNVPIAGHSSNDFTAAGNSELKFIFARLEQLEEGDTFYLNYEGTRYTYTITGKKVVTPQQVGELRIGDEKPYATLITCTPLGTARDRLLVFAEQVSPALGEAQAAPDADQQTDTEPELAGKSPTFFERIFGGN